MTPSSLMNCLVLFFLALTSLVSSSPVSKRDVFVPPIIYPHQGTVWFVGQTHNVKWYVVLQACGYSLVLS